MPDTARRGQWGPLLHALPHMLLAVSTTLALLHDDVAWRDRLVTAAIAVVTAGWYWWWVTAHPAWIERLRPMLVYFVGLLALTWVLMTRDLGFVWFTMGAYVQAFVFLPRSWAYLGVVGTASVVALASMQHQGDSSIGAYLPGFIFSVLLAGGIGLFVRAVEAQSERRKQIIVELERTSAQLAELAEQNTELQAQLLGQAREAGVLAERQRMAREIHDTLAQGLTAILTQLTAVENAMGDPRKLRARVDMARDIAKESLGEARRALHALRPEPLQDAQLPEALSNVSARWSAASGVAAVVVCTGDARPLHTDVEVTLLRVVQEALANVAKHAEASKVAVTLSYMEDVVVVDIRDDGVGFEVTDDQAGFGLTALRHRLTRLAGTFVVESSPGQGTAICATVPAIPPGEPNDQRQAADPAGDR